MKPKNKFGMFSKLGTKQTFGNEVFTKKGSTLCTCKEVNRRYFEGKLFTISMILGNAGFTSVYIYVL